MDFRLRFFLLMFTIILLLIIFRMIRKSQLMLKYSLVWIGILAVMLVCILNTPIIEVFSDLVGIVTPMNALFFIAFMGELLIIFSLTVVLSRQSAKIKSLSQRIAIIEHKYGLAEDVVSKVSTDK